MARSGPTTRSPRRSKTYERYWTTPALGSSSASAPERCAAGAGRPVVTLENHTIIGGLADAVASSLMFGDGTRTVPTIRRVGLPVEFLGTRALPTLYDKYRLSTDAIVKSVHGWLG